MEESDALDALSALAQPLRLAAFRRLVATGAEGLPAGELALALGCPPSTLSAALALLERAGLVQGQRQGRSIRYRARIEGLRDLLGFLIEDCCGGRPDLCRPALDALPLPRCAG